MSSTFAKTPLRNTGFPGCAMSSMIQVSMINDRINNMKQAVKMTEMLKVMSRTAENLESDLYGLQESVGAALYGQERLNDLKVRHV